MLLTSIPSPELQYFEVGPFRVHIYALCIIFGVIVAAIVTGKRLAKRGGERSAAIDLTVWSVIAGVIGARVFHVLTHWDDFFGAGRDPLEVFQIWRGGIAIFGALIGGAGGVLIASRMTGIRFLSFADALVPGLLLAQAFGRLGNYFNHELFGAPTTLPWGLEISLSNPAYPLGLPSGVLFHPTFLYEMIWNFAGVVVLLLIERKLRPRWGTFFAMYLVWYGFGRFVIEGMRLDPSFIVVFGLRTNQLAALLAIVLGIALYCYQKTRHTGIENNVYLPGKYRPGKSVLPITSDPSKYHMILAHTGVVASVTKPSAKDTES
ncbi:prolipoprotein diacylglyceryl transferase [Canibacter sp. lx-72]|uniref:prolipoprotein diacylglyceryl transferase n=1 Tax=Canibacter zhuwentaonis TaxID=2837491 RepID=UPI001BDD43ED|nr:prolipoprotein diacylglyceryl transferase [Canibacter zhuwentaonis]MBT1017702.1 prolipoprotein diacylglyceryl transferase [Canibacter zhuwentaonis]